MEMDRGGFLMPDELTQNYWIKKIWQLLILLAAVACFSFILSCLSPIDPVKAYIGADMLLVGSEQEELIAQRWGLEDPPAIRFFRWLGQTATGNLGVSAIYNQPVIDVIGSRFVTSIWLMGSAWLISGVFGFILGVIAGAMPDSIPDRIIRFYAYLLASTPTFWLGLLLLIFFSVKLDLFPICCAGPPGMEPSDITFLNRIHHLILPAAALSITGIARIILHTRQKLVEVMQSDFVRFARAKGESQTGIVLHHGIRNIALPALTIQFASLSELFGGSVLVESVFSYPGLGDATVQAGLRGDVPLLLGIVMFSAIFVFTGNTIADVLYRIIDPRIRIGEST